MVPKFEENTAFPFLSRILGMGNTFRFLKTVIARDGKRGGAPGLSVKYLILDLDNTLYPKSSGLLQAIDDMIDDYLVDKLKAPLEEVTRRRQAYCKEYGTTLGGLVARQEIDPYDYMAANYDLDLNRLITKDSRLGQMLSGINLPKIVFSNSPAYYIRNVLSVLGIHQHIDKIYDIEFCNYLGKPDLSSYRKVLADLKTSGEQCIFVDDLLINVTIAAQEGLKAIWLNSEAAALSPRHPVKWEIESIYNLSGRIEEIFQTELSA